MEWLLVVGALWGLLMVVSLILSTVLHREGEAEIVGLIGSAGIVVLVVAGVAISILGPVLDSAGWVPAVLLIAGVVALIVLAERLGNWVVRHPVATTCAVALSIAVVSVAIVLTTEL